MQDTNIINCKSCGNSFAGRFCNNCGEKVYTDHDKSMSHLFEEVFHFITHFDNKFFTTLFLFFRKPGFVSSQFCEGIRNKYFRPFSVFMIGVIVYLLFPLLQGLNISFKSHLNQDEMLHINFVKNWAVSKSAHRRISLADLGKEFDQKSPGVSKICLILIVPLTALALSGMFFSRGKYYFDHFILAAEINSFYLFFTFFLIPGLFYLLDYIVRIFNKDFYFSLNDVISVPLYFIFMSVFSVLAFKKFYQVETFTAILRTMLFLFLHSLIVYILYRLILYTIVMLLI